MNLFLPKELVDYINDFIRPLPSLHTIANWRKGSIKFDINELKCAYRMSYNLDMYIRKKYYCSIHNNYNIMMNSHSDCNCDHIVRPYFISNFIWRGNYLATWKETNKENILIWHYVDINECDKCGNLQMIYHMKKIDDKYICNWCV